MLTTVERLKKTMQIADDDNESDDMLLLQIAASSQAIENYCKRSFGKQIHTELVSGYRSSRYVNLRNYPIARIESLIASDKEVSGFMILDDGRVYHPEGWSAGEHNIRATYEAGYVLPKDASEENLRTLPEVLELACILHAQLMLRTPGVKSERVGDTSVGYSDDSDKLPPAVISLISPYVGRWV